MLRVSTPPEDFDAFMAGDAATDVRSLARQIRIPTLVIQLRGDQVNAIQYSQELADLISGARFVFIDGSDHIPISGDGENEQLMRVLQPFFDQDVTARAAHEWRLSAAASPFSTAYARILRFSACSPPPPMLLCWFAPCSGRGA
jgi:pimeloyl-ACP methyl ester carboxylesterase